MNRADVSIREGYAGLALEALDQSTAFYVAMRGVKRAILECDPLAEAQENNAEHSYHITNASLTFWENSAALGIDFTDDFSPLLMLTDVHAHDAPEVISGDVDSMTMDERQRRDKHQNELRALEELAQASPYLSWVANAAKAHALHASPEARFNSDVDRLAAIRVIQKHAPRRWHGYGGQAVTREQHDQRIREKLLTPFGVAVFGAIAAELDVQPHLFPADEPVLKATAKRG